MIATKLYFLFIGIALVSRVAIAEDDDSVFDEFLSAEDDTVPNLPEELEDILEAEVPLNVTVVEEELAVPIVEEEPLSTDEPAELEATTEATIEATETIEAVEEVEEVEEVAAVEEVEEVEEAATPETPAPPKKTNVGEFISTEGNVNNFFVLLANQKDQAAAAGGQINVGFASIIVQLLDQLSKVINVAKVTSVDAETQTTSQPESKPEPEPQPQPPVIGLEKIDELIQSQQELKAELANLINNTKNVENAQNQLPNELVNRLLRAARVLYESVQNALAQHGSNLGEIRKVFRESAKAVFKIIRMLIDAKIKATSSAAAVLQNTAEAFKE